MAFNAPPAPAREGVWLSSHGSQDRSMGGTVPDSKDGWDPSSDLDVAGIEISNKAAFPELKTEPQARPTPPTVTQFSAFASAQSPEAARAMADDGIALVTSDVHPPRPRPKTDTQAPAKAQLQVIIQQRSEPIGPGTPPQPSSAVPTVKKRGRPVGWRLGMGAYSSMTPGATPPPRQKKIKPSGLSTGYKRRGRPARKPSPSPKELYLRLKPRFYPFLCEWQDCPAELQNFETLRRHVLLVHGERRGSTTCKWATCAHKEIWIFASQEFFEEHLDKEHLIPFLWHFGEGPANRLKTHTQHGDKEEGKLPSYLLDANGEQITPSIRGQEEEDFVTWKKNRRRLNQVINQRNENAPYVEYPTDDDEDELQATDIR